MDKNAIECPNCGYKIVEPYPIDKLCPKCGMNYLYLKEPTNNVKYDEYCDWLIDKIKERLNIEGYKTRIRDTEWLEKGLTNLCYICGFFRMDVADCMHINTDCWFKKCDDLDISEEDYITLIRTKDMGVRREIMEKYIKNYNPNEERSDPNSRYNIRTTAHKRFQSLVAARIQKAKQEPLRQTRILQKWVYERATEQRFSPEKIILIALQKERSSYDYELKKMLKNFPKDPIEIEVEFPKDEDHDFLEIDMAIRFDKYLFLFEVKGTGTMIGGVRRAKIFDERLKNRVEEYVLRVIMTKNKLAKPEIMSPIDYLHYLKTLREQWGKGNMEEYLDSERL